MDERRVTRRVFVGDLWFLGAGLVGSIAWGWSHGGSAAEPQASPSATPPQPSPSTKPRTPEFDHEMPAGGIRHIPESPSPKPRTSEFDHPPVPGKPMPPPR